MGTAETCRFTVLGSTDALDVFIENDDDMILIMTLMKNQDKNKSFSGTSRRNQKSGTNIRELGKGDLKEIHRDEINHL